MMGNPSLSVGRAAEGVTSTGENSMLPPREALSSPEESRKTTQEFATSSIASNKGTRFESVVGYQVPIDDCGPVAAR